VAKMVRQLVSGTGSFSSYACWLYVILYVIFRHLSKVSFFGAPPGYVVAGRVVERANAWFALRPRLTLLACAIAFTLARLTLDLYLPDCVVVEATLMLPCCRIAWSSDLVVRHRVVYYDVGCSDDDDARKFRIEWNEHCCARQRASGSSARWRMSGAELAIATVDASRASFGPRAEAARRSRRSGARIL
jgi:hypothetical protein